MVRLAGILRDPRWKQLRREMLWVLLGRALGAVGAVASLKILTQLLTVEEFGLFGLGLALASGASRLLFSPIAGAGLRFTSATLAREGPAHLAAMIGPFYLLMSALVLLLAGLGRATLGGFALHPVIPFAALLGCLLGMNMIQFSLLNAMRERAYTALIQVMNGWGRGILAAPLMLAVAANAWVAMLGYVLALAATNTVVMGAVARRFGLSPVMYLRRPQGVGVARRYFCAYVAPLFLTFAVEAAIHDGDKLLVAQLLTIYQVGVFVAVQQIARPVILFFVGPVEQLAYPIFFERARQMGPADVDGSVFKRALLLFTVVTVPILALVPLTVRYGDVLVASLTSDEYARYAELLPILLVSYLLNQAARILETPGLIAMKSHVFIAPKLLQAAAMATGIVVWAPTYGVVGAGYGILAGALVLLLAIAVVNGTLYWKLARQRRPADVDA